MKRRNGELPKLRRPLKRNKITDGIYGSAFIYLKFFMLWALVILADFILEFRFEFLWPFWLLLRSVYDSYKYQGLAFSVFFVSIALTSDMICYFFIPVQWLFFAASTYVWVQYVWHTEKGICLPTVVLWLLFAYIEAAVRLKDLRHMPFHLDLCRPFAAHCIGYPVVTLGFGFKSYVSFRIRQRRQREVRKENGFYMTLLSQALPIEELSSSVQPTSPPKIKGESNGVGPPSGGHKGSHRKSLDKGHSESYSNGTIHQDLDLIEKIKCLNGSAKGSTKHQNCSSSSSSSSSSSNSSGGGAFRMLCFRRNNQTNGEAQDYSSVSSSVTTTPTMPSPVSNSSSSKSTPSSSGSSAPGPNTVKTAKSGNKNGAQQQNAKKSKSIKEAPSPVETPHNHDYCQKMESELKRLKGEVQTCRQNESWHKSLLNTMTKSEKSARAELTTLRQNQDVLQSKVQSLMSCRAADQKSISVLEKKLADERKLRTTAEAALAQEQKSAKAAQKQQQMLQKSSLAVGGPTSMDSRTSNGNGDCCNEGCRSRRRDLETEVKTLRRDLKEKEGKCASADRELQSLIQYKESQAGAEMLLKAVSVLQDKNSHLENSLSAETRIKLDLFSALGEAKRHVEIRDSVIRSQEREIEELKTKLAQVLAVMPAASDFLTVQHSSMVSSGVVSVGKLRGLGQSDALLMNHQQGGSAPNSNLDPNATVYTPKPSRVVSEA